MSLVPLDFSGDKGLSIIWSMIHLVSSFSLKTFVAVLQGASLLRQTSPVNGHSNGLCIPHCAYRHSGVESHEDNKRVMTLKPCALPPAHKANHLRYCSPECPR
ncbi:hypothetical protein TNIN_157821 [Trichonephila inaurata madagascariensis]|uniref:Uncharacterized protein n=1 Tax=Trichonephila inaurata madagascariensis TaxID=2747483 RepID=A0A8X7CSC3_9ARAC|nr:hypothetical protein TNIN_157821 [Trichonephila inaurata madagascariensis]